MDTLALLFGLTLLVAGCGSSTSSSPAGSNSNSSSGSIAASPSATDFVPSTPAPAPEGWKLRTDTELGFGFDYPAEWTAGKLGAQTTVTSADKRANLLWISGAAPIGGTLDDYKLVDIASFQQAPEWQGPVSIGGVAGWGVELHVDDNGTNYFVIDYFTVYAGRSYDFIWMSSPGSEAADRQLYQQIESTFKFSH